jgi:hypothetical protein
MKLSTRAIHTYRRSLKAWMGYVAEKHWSDEFQCPAVTVLGALLDPVNGQMSDFLQRYPRRERDRRRHEVRYVVLLWLAELAL